MASALKKRVVSQYSWSQCFPGIALIAALLVGCTKTERAVPETDAKTNAEQRESNENGDAALAIAYANNWLLEPSLETAVKVQQMLGEAMASQSPAVNEVLAKVNSRVAILEQEAKFTVAVTSLENGDLKQARTNLESYLSSGKPAESEKAKNYLAMIDRIEKLPVTDFLSKLSVAQLEEVARADEAIKGFVGEDDPIATFWAGVGGIWLARIKTELPQTLKFKRAQIREALLKERVEQWQAQYADASQELSHSHDIVQAHQDISKAKELAKFQVDNSARWVDDRVMDFLQRHGVAADSKGVATALNALAAIASTLESKLMQDKSFDGQAYFIDPDSQKNVSGFEIKHGARLFELAPFQFGKQGDFFSSTNTKESLEALVGDPYRQFLQRCVFANDAIIIDQENQKQWIVDKWVRNNSGGVTSCVTGLNASSPSDLYLSTFDYGSRESHYKPLQQKTFVNRRTVLRPWNILHIKLSDVPGWLVAENNLRIGAKVANGEVDYIRLSASSKDETLVDVYLRDFSLGKFQLAWRDTTDDGDWSGSIDTEIIEVQDAYYDTLQDGIAEVVKWGKMEGDSLARMRGFKAVREDTAMEVRLRFPKPLYAITTFEGVLSPTLEISTDRKQWKKLLREKNISQPELLEQIVLRGKGIGDTEQFIREFLGVIPGYAITESDYRKWEQRKAQNYKEKRLVIDYQVIDQLTNGDPFQEFYLRFVIPRGEGFSLSEEGAKFTVLELP